jgi:hypothetical protein
LSSGCDWERGAYLEFCDGTLFLLIVPADVPECVLHLLLDVLVLLLLFLLVVVVVAIVTAVGERG